MIIEGALAGNVGFWSKHLKRADTNERVILHETRGAGVRNIRAGHRFKTSQLAQHRGRAG